MDITTIVGLIAGFTLLVMGILNGGDLSFFVDVPSLLIVIGGTCAAFLVSFPLREVVAFDRILRYVFYLPKRYKRLAYPELSRPDPAEGQAIAEDAEKIKKELNLGILMFKRLKTYALAFGIIPVLIGFVIMLANLDDLSAVGPGVALALITPLYGAIIAYLICLPFQTKLERRLEALQC